MKLYKPIEVDLYNLYPLKKMNAQQDNAGRGALVTLTAAGMVIAPTGETVTLWAKKPDGTVSYLPCTVADGKIKADFTNQMLAIVGSVQVELQMVDGENNITTPIFTVEVHPSNIDSSAVESQNEFTALVKALQDVEELKKNGLKGDPGEAATISVGTVTASAPGGEPVVTNSGTSSAAVFDFVLPRGETGPAGGVAGVKGAAESDYRTGDVNITSNNIAAQSLAPTEIIPANSDLDDYVEHGCYRVRNSSDAGTIGHSPVTNQGYMLSVYNIYGLGNPVAITQVVQLYRWHTYSRYRYGNNPWSDWEYKEAPMTGATASTAGKAGLVPAPAAGAQNKVLKGSGTWGETETLKYVESEARDFVIGDMRFVSFPPLKIPGSRNYLFASIANWGSATTVFSIAGRNRAFWIIGDPGGKVNALVLRFWYTE